MASPIPTLVGTPIVTDVASTLAMAMVAASNAPLLLLDGDLRVIAASSSFLHAFAIEHGMVVGRRLADVGTGEWKAPQVTALLKATASGFAAVDAYEMDLERPGHLVRHLVLNARRLDYDDADNVRLLLSVLDVTEARFASDLKDKLVREKAILLQELQHRVANSLQIVASVLMQSARRVNSDETRGHLYDAHHRILSVAAVQRQLAVTTLSEVGLRMYLTDLCHSIGASMIRDPTLITLEVKVDDTVTSPDASVSLGLIVTELVINALKHAFPGFRSGKIKVDYRAVGDGWKLSISDDGVGISDDPPKAGLGTSIVSALATQLEANVRISDGHPGTVVTIART